MPKKLNFLGGQQNYDPKTGEYEPDLTNKQGEPVKGFSSFKKSDAEKQKTSFDTYNDKRTGKEESKTESSESFEEVNNKRIGKTKKPEIDTSTQEGKREHNKWTAENTEPGKVIKYHPLLRSVDNANGFTFGEETDRAKMLNNGLAMRTKKVTIGGYFKDANGKYKAREGYGIIDVETGLVAGKAESYEDALEMSANNKEYLDKINRARDNFKQKYAHVFSNKPQEQKSEETQEDKEFNTEIKKTADKIRSSGDRYTYMMLDRLRSDAEYVTSEYGGKGAMNQLWYNGDPKKHIALMRELHRGLKEKPEWLTLDKIAEYEKKLKELK